MSCPFNVDVDDRDMIATVTKEREGYLGSRASFNVSLISLTVSPEVPHVAVYNSTVNVET